MRIITLAESKNQRSHRHPNSTNLVISEEGGPFCAMSQTEHEELRRNEEILERGLKTFFEFGSALMTIRDKRLYRATHKTFEQYCHDRWTIGRAYAYRLIGAAERIKLLPPANSIPPPKNEFQIRPFLKLEAESFPGAWKRAIDIAKEGKITPSVVRAVMQELVPNGSHQKHERKDLKSSRRRVPVGQIIVLLSAAKQKVTKHEEEAVIELLERIESLLIR